LPPRESVAPAEPVTAAAEERALALVSVSVPALRLTAEAPDVPPRVVLLVTLTVPEPRFARPVPPPS